MKLDADGIHVDDWTLKPSPALSTSDLHDQQPGHAQAVDAARLAEDAAEHPALAPVGPSESEEQAAVDVDTAIAAARVVNTTDLPIILHDPATGAVTNIIPLTPDR